MHRIFSRIFSVAVFVCPLLTSAQQVQFKTVDSVAEKVVRFFNAKQADSIYELTGASFRKELNQSAFNQISNRQLFPNGTIKALKLDHFENGLAEYEAVFEKNSLRLLLSLDTEKRIHTFLWQPYPQKVIVKKRPVLSDNPLRTALDKRVNELLLKPMMDSSIAGLSIGLLRNDSAFFYNYGETRFPGGQRPDKHTLYEIGSISKTFTSLLLANAVEEERLHLEDPANRYLPATVEPLQVHDTAISLVSLSNHTSGLPRMPTNMLFADPEDPYTKYDTTALYWFLNHVQLNRAAGEAYEYSNLAAGLLGVILERIYRKSYADLIKEKICEPLALTATKQYLSVSDSLFFSTPHNKEGKATKPWNFLALAGAGALRSNTEDLIRYASFYLHPPDNNLGKAALLTQQISFEGAGQKVGLGWHFLNLGETRIAQHSGGTGGFRSFIAFNRESNTALVILSNSASREFADIGMALMRELSVQ